MTNLEINVFFCIKVNYIWSHPRFTFHLPLHATQPSLYSYLNRIRRATRDPISTKRQVQRDPRVPQGSKPTSKPWAPLGPRDRVPRQQQHQKREEPVGQSSVQGLERGEEGGDPHIARPHPDRENFPKVAFQICLGICLSWEMRVATFWSFSQRFTADEWRCTK